MKKKLIVLSCLLVFICACSQSDKKTGSATEKGPFKDKVEHAFSDKVQKDLFEVTLTGDKPGNMELLFTITRYSGEKIYDLKIKATDLLGSTDPNVDLRKEADQVKFIRTVAKEFLSAENFLVPAVTEDQVADDYTPDKDFYLELKNSGLNGFTYRLGKENNFYIAWSQKDQKVKVYYNCC